MVVLENPSFLRGVGGIMLALLLHIISSSMWVVALSSAYWSRGSYSFLQALDAVHTVGVWKTCITYINLDPYTNTWHKQDGACWSTSKYLFDPRIEIANILSFLVCMFIVVVIGLYGLLYTNKSCRPFLKSAALPACKLVQMSLGLTMILVFSSATDVANNVRLWARHLAMAAVVVMAVEVLYGMVIGFTHRTWRTCVRESCADMSVYVTGCARDFPGEAHRPKPPSTVDVIQNNSAVVESSAPWPVELEPEVQIACTWPTSVVLEIEEDEIPTASQGRGQKMKSPFKNLFGRSPDRNTSSEQTRSNTENNKRRRIKTNDESHTTPIASRTSRNSEDASRTVTFADENSSEETSRKSEWTELSAMSSPSAMSRRDLPPLPRPIPEFPKKISNEVQVLDK